MQKGRDSKGVATSKAMFLLGQKYRVELPITQAVYEVCYGEGDDERRCKEAIGSLFSRRTRAEIE